MLKTSATVEQREEFRVAQTAAGLAIRASTGKLLECAKGCPAKFTSASAGGDEVTEIADFDLSLTCPGVAGSDGTTSFFVSSGSGRMSNDKGEFLPVDASGAVARRDGEGQPFSWSTMADGRTCFRNVNGKVLTVTPDEVMMSVASESVGAEQLFGVGPVSP
jgi:hypothetical protein